MLGILVIVLSVGINVAKTFAVAAYPYPSVLIFTDTQDGTGEIIFEVLPEGVSH